MTSVILEHQNQPLYKQNMLAAVMQGAVDVLLQ